MATRTRPVGDDLKRLAKLIRRDPVITARVIGAANSAAYAAHAPTASIHAAIMRLGVLAVRRIAFLLSLYNAVPVAPAERKAFWRHSLAVAYAAEVITRHVPTWSAGQQMDNAFLAALLHDLGLLAIGR